jgi:hypothetical protein
MLAGYPDMARGHRRLHRTSVLRHTSGHKTIGSDRCIDGPGPRLSSDPEDCGIV